MPVDSFHRAVEWRGLRDHLGCQVIKSKSFLESPDCEVPRFCGKRFPGAWSATQMSVSGGSGRPPSTLSEIHRISDFTTSPTLASQTATPAESAQLDGPPQLLDSDELVIKLAVRKVTHCRWARLHSVYEVPFAVCRPVIWYPTNVIIEKAVHTVVIIRTWFFH